MAFVQAATEDYGIRGRPTNISRVAVMTGLTRKEVKSIREKGWVASRESEESWWESNFPPSDILHFWHTDPEFVDAAGDPRALTFSGGSPSFTDLTRRYAGDIPPGAMRVELKRTGAISEGEDGLLVPLVRYCVPFDLDTNFVQTIGYSVSRLANTVLTNSQQFELPPEERDSNFEKYVWTQNLSDEDKEDFKELVEKRAMALLVELDDWIGVREQRANVGSEGKNRGVSQRSVTGDCGLGVFYFADDE